MFALPRLSDSFRGHSWATFNRHVAFSTHNSTLARRLALRSLLRLFYYFLYILCSLACLVSLGAREYSLLIAARCVVLPTRGSGLVFSFNSPPPSLPSSSHLHLSQSKNKTTDLPLSIQYASRHCVSTMHSTLSAMQLMNTFVLFVFYAMFLPLPQFYT
jgi:hypothetical protein